MPNLYRAPLYIQIENAIEKKILNDEYTPGAKLPGERELAKTYGVNRMTVKKAILNLVQRGLVFRKQGSGTYIQSRGTKEKFFFDLDFSESQKNSGISELMSSKGINVTSDVVGKENLHNIEFFNRKLLLSPNSDVFALHRVRKTNEKPFAIEYSYLPADLFNDASKVNFKNIGLYDYMDVKGHGPSQVDQVTSVIPAMSKEARLLKVNENQDLYYIEYTSADKTGRIVEYTESYINPKIVNLQFTIPL